MKTTRFLVFLSIFAAAVALQGYLAANADECAVTYANFGKGFVAQYCLKCHDSAKSGFFKRFGAPAGVDFDKVEVIQKEKKDMLKLVLARRMPPYPPKPKDDELAKLKSWLECEYKPAEPPPPADPAPPEPEAK